jgi:hypothetical protein
MIHSATFDSVLRSAVSVILTGDPIYETIRLVAVILDAGTLIAIERRKASDGHSITPA